MLFSSMRKWRGIGGRVSDGVNGAGRSLFVGDVEKGDGRKSGNQEDDVEPTMVKVKLEIP